MNEAPERCVGVVLSRAGQAGALGPMVRDARLRVTMVDVEGNEEDAAPPPEACECLLLLPASGPLHALELLVERVPDTAVVLVVASDVVAHEPAALRRGAHAIVSLDSLDGPKLRRAVEVAIARCDRERIVARRGMTDELTGLPTRALMLDRIAPALARAAREGTMTALVFLDLDTFKLINDRLGHPEGDRLLVEVSRTLEAGLRPSDTVSRYGGDEFVVLCERVGGAADAVRIARRVRDLVASLAPQLGGVPMSASVGVAVAASVSGARGDGVDALIADADAAMYEAKRNGGGRVVLARPSPPVLREAGAGPPP